MNRYKLIVSYDGTSYAGWQIQPNGVTIQAKLETAVGELCGEQAKVHGSGRTDQGVHAKGQVAHLDLKRDWEPVNLLKGLNAHLPLDIRVLKVNRSDAAFHARRSATRKEYRYFICDGDIMPPWKRHYAAHVRNRLDVAAMAKAAACLVGRHDFAAFSANPSREIESTVREVYAISVKRRGPEIVIRVSGNGFLYKMVRSVAGFLIRVGEGAVPPEATRGILRSGTRTAVVPTAPPEGLFLWNVSY